VVELELVDALDDEEVEVEFKVEDDTP